MEDIIEQLYRYKQSLLYQIHLVLVIVLWVYMLALAMQEWKVRNRAYQFK